jgi:hypothetical protein
VGTRKVVGIRELLAESCEWRYWPDINLLSDKHGLGADQALEWQVVTINGNVVTATPTEHPDLHWTLSGDRGGTYDAVLSLTARAYPDSIIGGLTFAFTLPSGKIDDNILWDAVSFFHCQVLPGILDAGAHIQWAVYGLLFIEGTTIPGTTEDDMRSVMKSFIDYLTNQAILY